MFLRGIARCASRARAMLEALEMATRNKGAATMMER